MQQPEVEIVILDYNGHSMTDKCLKSVYNSDYPNLKVTLVDNGSHSNKLKEIAKNYPGLKFVINEKNLGFAEGNNVVLRRSNAKYNLLFNNDAVMEPDAITRLVNFMERYPQVAACQPKVFSLRNPGYFDHAGAAGAFIDKYGYGIYRGSVFDVSEKDEGQYNKAIETFFACGVAMMIRREVLFEVGYLDHDFFLYGEELDLCWRMRLAGHKICYVPSARIHHLGRATSSEMNSRAEYLLHRNHYLMLFKNYSWKSLMKIVPVKTLLEVLAFYGFIFLKPKKSWAVFKATLWIYTHPFTLIRKHNETQSIRRVEDSEIQEKMVNQSVALRYFFFGKDKFSDYTIGRKK